jgi:putative membrane protein
VPDGDAFESGYHLKMRLFAALCALAALCPTPAVASDADFLQSALKTEVGQYGLGVIGQQKGHAVKNFAVQLTGEASRAVDQLKNVARDQHVEVVEDAELRAKAQYVDLQGRTGRDFDETLAHDAMIDTNIAIDAFTDEAEHGIDPTLRRFAQAQLPKLRVDLKMSQDLGG